VAATSIRRGQLTVSEWVRSIRGVRERHWFAADDPAPFLARMGVGLRRRFQRNDEAPDPVKPPRD
jgi:hypothetical protein